jgi:hypothetical protein
MPKVYALEFGQYSSRHVVGVFTSRRKANIARKAFREAGYTIYEFELDDQNLLKFVRLTLKRYDMRFDDSGNVVGFDCDDKLEPWDDTGCETLVVRSRGTMFDKNAAWRVHISARDQAEAIKAAWEHVVQRKAETNA